METQPDPFAELELAAKRQALEEKGLGAARAARARLVLGTDAKSAFFASLAMRLELKTDWSVETAATDGKNFFLNPEWFLKLVNDEQTGIWAHEAGHVALLHHTRREGRDAKQWNEAADLSLNQLLNEAGFKLPKGMYLPGTGKHKDFPTGKSTEEYYSLLRDEKEEQANQEGEGESEGQGNDPGGCGEVRDAGDPSERAQQEAEWKVAVAQAREASKSRGELPGGLSLAVNEALYPKVDWRDALREFVNESAKKDFSWSRPNRRFIADELYLPGRSGMKLGSVVIAVDCSGSIGGDLLDKFASEASGILEAHECSAVIAYHDVEVLKVQEWDSDMGPLKLEPVGGGGTSHIPFFNWLSQSGMEPACVIALTDGYSMFPPSPSDMPVMWAIVNNPTFAQPFGSKVDIDQG